MLVAPSLLIRPWKHSEKITPFFAHPPFHSQESVEQCLVSLIEEWKHTSPPVHDISMGVALPRLAFGHGPADQRTFCAELGAENPMRFHKLGTYELRGRHAALFAANLRAIDNLSPRTASRLVHRLGESSTPQAWEQQHREFLANGGLAPGLEGDLYFISQELFANKLHACPPPFYSQEQLSKIWKERSFAKLYLLNDEHMEDPDGAYRMALDSWTPPDWRAGTSSSRAWWH